MADDSDSEHPYRRELNVKLISLVVGVIGIGLGLVVKFWVIGLLQGPSAHLATIALTPQTRGAHLEELQIRPTRDELAGASDPGVRVESKLTVHRYKHLVVVCYLTGADGYEQRERMTWDNAHPQMTPCWFPIIGPARSAMASVRVFEPGDRRDVLDEIGPRRLRGT